VTWIGRSTQQGSEARAKPLTERERWLLAILPVALLLYVYYALLWHHLQIPHPLLLFRHPLLLFKSPDDPPFMELTLLLVGIGGCCVIAKGTKGWWPPGTGLVSLFLTGLAYCGWYWTEILYDRLVIYSYYAQSHSLLKLTQ
jgi:hypothetical protein